VTHYNCVIQAADDEIEIFVPGASKRLSADSTDTASNVSLSSVESTPGSDSNVELPTSSSELPNASLDTSLTPKAESLCAGDVCSTTLVEETADAVIATGDRVDGLKPPSPPSDESRNEYAECVAEQTADIADDQFFPASEGELLSSLLCCNFLHIRAGVISLATLALISLWLQYCEHGSESVRISLFVSWVGLD